MNRILYLHGFASGPQSAKGRFFASQFAQIGAETVVPDLNEDDFFGLTITRQLRLVDRIVQEVHPTLLIGSSMGGYVAALYAAVRPNLVPALTLLAPAFGFPGRWIERLGPQRLEAWRSDGSMRVPHYGTGRLEAVGYGLFEDGQWHDDLPLVTQPALVFHGKNDAEVPAQLSVDFARLNPSARLELVDSDHSLTDQLDFLWAETARFYQTVPAPAVGS
ncbi:MAG: alpha/beta fold hydrolase [Acidobacteria bacterium]|nr:alpha/beta fold hydrolase [Acidobacteriota bacterium]